MWKCDSRRDHARLVAQVLEDVEPKEMRVHNGQDLFAGLGRDAGAADKASENCMKISFKVRSARTPPLAGWQVCARLRLAAPH